MSKIILEDNSLTFKE